MKKSFFDRIFTPCAVYEILDHSAIDMSDFDADDICGARSAAIMETVKHPMLMSGVLMYVHFDSYALYDFFGYAADIAHTALQPARIMVHNFLRGFDVDMLCAQVFHAYDHTGYGWRSDVACYCMIGGAVLLHFRSGIAAAVRG